LDPLVHPREHTLGRLTLVLGLLAWALLVVGTFGLVFVYVLLGVVGYLFAQSAFIAHLKGNGVRLSPEQFPQLFQRFESCCDKLDIPMRPEAYVLHGDGMLNAFATRFLGRDFVVLLTQTLEAMDKHPDGVNFYIGHELGHVRQKHLTGWKWRAPVLWLPLLGAAYARSREYTCDRHGAACCSSPELASRSLAALAAGSTRWQDLALKAFAQQAAETRGFWMSFHELIGGYPWLCKRLLAVLRPQTTMPKRHPLAWLLALLVPNTGAGPGGLLVTVAMVGVLAAVGLPAYQDYTVRTSVAQQWFETRDLREALAHHYRSQGAVPGSLAEVRQGDRLADGSELELDAERMAVTVHGPKGSWTMVPSPQDNGTIEWGCEAGEGLSAKAMPPSCRGE
jgi:Zn-dependent protease with chaperone function/Tfp pilus assembly protein PilE